MLKRRETRKLGKKWDTMILRKETPFLPAQYKHISNLEEKCGGRQWAEDYGGGM
jgi:hypothetical protein